ncbi:glutamine amidotransferase [Lactobacillus delbrueckii subsp. delbrueckii DSM 20074 = JCM 1012]|nr:glutamine amidotransferase [Lactobacillus delbrueckii subsp. delbrueckii DSM 20074 = JCM 1012]
MILSGGHDLDPHLYGEEIDQKSGETWPDRDALDMALLKRAEETGKPVLGICRGAQIINVAHGGSMWQDLSLRPGNTLMLISHKLLLKVLYHLIYQPFRGFR